MSRVLILSPSTFGYERRITAAVGEVGHDVLWHDERIGNSITVKVLTRLRLVRFVPGFMAFHVNKIISAAKSIDAETILIVNPETLRTIDYRKVREAFPNSRIVIYKWDSLKQKPLDEETYKWVDAIYSFDPDDCKKDHRLKHWPLFHCHKARQEPNEQPTYQYDFAFVGSAHLRRIKLLAKAERQLNAAQRPYFFKLVSPSPFHHLIFVIARKWFGYTSDLSLKALDYSDYLNVISQSRCILDVEFQRQSGLTMRTIEVVFSGTPLATTNTELKHYEFYDANRMFFLDEDKLMMPSLENADQLVDEELYNKYSITNWVNLVLEGKTKLTWEDGQWK